MKLTVNSAEEMELLGARLARVARAGDVIVLTGELGAGKTTFARGFGRGRNVQSGVSSPTFIVARTHPVQDLGAPPLVHIDAYRVGSIAEMDELDVDVAGSIVLAEWAAPYVLALSDSWLDISFERPSALRADGGEGDEPRTLTLSVNGPRATDYERYLDQAQVAP
jgi:tRNA threonylcarbamoyladenosine biosynthesis protein TsaE